MRLACVLYLRLAARVWRVARDGARERCEDHAPSVRAHTDGEGERCSRSSLHAGAEPVDRCVWVSCQRCFGEITILCACVHIPSFFRSSYRAEKVEPPKFLNSAGFTPLRQRDRVHSNAILIRRKSALRARRVRGACPKRGAMTLRHAARSNARHKGRVCHGRRPRPTGRPVMRRERRREHRGEHRWRVGRDQTSAPRATAGFGLLAFGRAHRTRRARATARRSSVAAFGGHHGRSNAHICVGGAL